MKKTVPQFIEAKENKEKLTMVTAYDYSIAKLVDNSNIDSILVGDSLGMVMLGYENTLQVTMEDMIHHARAVVKGAKNTMVIVDMPFMSYHVSIEKAVENAGRLIKETNATAVKLEGGIEMADTIKAIVRAQIPVVGHIGLTPQSVNIFGGFKVQGKSVDAAKKLIEDAKAIEAAGAYAIVLECVPEKLAKIISEELTIPTIGIGAGNVCDGQVLVYQDMLNMFSEFKPKFVKTYADIGNEIIGAFNKYAEEVKTEVFPAKEHTFAISDDVIEKLY
ncbi:MAG: 3-methyl-2-oxobutanoate hydroxymethyltransferase [Fusobacteriaceae bacterium]|jgi:3-methyl-2-oxobutanoate hydroxymethyltransferase|nr:ketopantoate hydroxymethyltransferase [Fusobacteriales bacterium]MDN5303420.1 3-methyl-2-oxobutanoate hydroxymethyltransferase [Fusobacteriaceae bacterium]